MKSRKVLLGLIVGVAMCFAGTAMAQKANFQNNTLVEIGPDNIGGRVTSLVVFNQDDNVTMYAGAATGGLYTRTNEENDIWNYVPCYVNGEELTLPISNLVKLNDSMMVVATGEGYYPMGSRVSKFTALGRGLFIFNTNTKEFTRVNGTNPGTDFEANFASVNSMAQVTMQGVTYLYVATHKGLFRWALNSVDQINSTPVLVHSGNVSNVVLSKQFNRAFYNEGGRLFKISDIINASTPVEITSSCEAFVKASDLKLALAPSDESYLYAMAITDKGLMSGLYLTRNTNSWQLLTTTSVVPFNSIATAKTCGTLAVNPVDPSQVIIGGADIWVGKGYVENSPYQWTVSSSNENALNMGDYMADVYSSAAFVHSGIHSIVSVTKWNDMMLDWQNDYYITTDGGVYASYNNLGSYTNLNRGMNNVQINSLAVSPDGSIISGANANACPFIEGRTEHSGGANDSSWYDASRSNLNHMANIIWKGNGGGVAASRFTQYSPLSRRPIFVSSANGSVGRAYADYSNYFNSQTWTTEEYFTADRIAGGPAIGQIYLWETDNNTYTNDVMTFSIDTIGYIHRNGERMDINSNFKIQAGDSMMVLDPAHAQYPFWHVFDHGFTVKDELRHTVHTPYLSRLLMVSVEKDYPLNTNVSMCWFPTDFRKTVVTPSEGNIANDERFWAHIYGINGGSNPGMGVRYTTMTQNGDCALVVVEDTKNNKSFIARVKGINSVDYTREVHSIRADLDYNISTRLTTTDTIQATDTSIFFGRRISSITIDPREGKDAAIITFDGFNAEGANVVYIDNVSGANPTIRQITVAGGIPAYSAMIEKTHGNVFVGTEDGVFKAESVNSSNWQTYGSFAGVPVTAMFQVTNDNKLIRHLGHDGVAEIDYIFPKTKWAYAMYFGTYGRGIFMDTTYVVDHTNEIVTPDIYLGVPTVNGNSDNSVRFYPNPAVDNATMELNIAKAGNATLVIYDLTGKVVMRQQLGRLAEGVHTSTISCQGLQHGMYLVNVIVGGQKATSKLIVK